MINAEEIKNDKKSLYCGVSVYNTDLCRILVPGYYIRHIHECVGVQLLVPNADERHDICWFD